MRTDCPDCNGRGIIIKKAHRRRCKRCKGSGKIWINPFSPDFNPTQERKPIIAKKTVIVSRQTTIMFLTLPLETGNDALSRVQDELADFSNFPGLVDLLLQADRLSSPSSAKYGWENV